MKAVYIRKFGGPEFLEIREIPEPPKPSGTQTLINVRAAGLNRADILQRRGAYPPPNGYSANVPGLEFAGEVAENGDAAKRFRPGDRVFGITAGEAQAEQVLVDESLLAAIPENVSFVEAAAFPEVFITAHDAVFVQAGLQTSETLLIHAVGSGVGLAALQLAKARGSRVLGTSRTAQKLERCVLLGLDVPILVREDFDFSAAVLDNTARRGVDVVLDLVGGAYFSQTILSLAEKGRVMVVGLSSGRTAGIDLGAVLQKRAVITGTTLRGRTVEEKADAVRRFEAEVVPLIASGKIAGNIDKVFPLGDVQAAHQYLESNESFGKIVLEV